MGRKPNNVKPLHEKKDLVILLLFEHIYPIFITKGVIDIRIIYTPSSLESWISESYKRMGMYRPWDLNIEQIAETCYIFLKFRDCPSFHYKNGYYRSIIINKNMTVERQREHFFHELGHFFRHPGSQLNMTYTQRSMQELKTKKFTSCAAIPYHMLSYVDFFDRNVILDTARIFKIPQHVSYYRLWKIKEEMTRRFLDE